MIFVFRKVICLLLCCVFLVGCYGKGNESVYEIIERVKTQVEIPDCEIYRYVRDDSQNQILSRLYSHDGGLPPAVAFCDDYLICLYQGNEIWELHMFRTISIYDNRRIYEMLVERRDLLQKRMLFLYDSEVTETRVRSAEIINYRNYVVLAVTDHNSIIRSEFEKTQ